MSVQALVVLAATLTAGAASPHAFSTLRLPATRENWPAQRDVLSRSRDCFDEIWFSACNFKSLEENAEKAKWLGEAAREVRAMGYIASLEFELTIGNTDTPESERMPFKDWTGFTGPEGWEGVRCNCPRDPKFHAYFREQMKYYGAWSPTVIWLDDDVRVDNHGKNRTGCFCERCLKAFSKGEGREWTREALVAAMKTDAALAARWRDHCFRGLGEFAFAFCKAVKEFSPASRVGFQYPWADEGQLRIVEAMVKAVGGPIEMRPGCCSYQDRNPFFQVDKTYRLQHQVKTLLAHPEWYSRLCPEIETYPRTFTTRTARSLGFEALLHLASGLDSLTWYIAGNAEPFDLYERTTFRAPRENMWLYREYVRRNEGAVQVGFDAPDGAEFPAVFGSSAIPYSFGTGRKLGTVVWLADQVKKSDEKTLQKMLAGAVLASREAAASLVERKLVPAEAVQLPKEEYSDSTAWFPKSVKTSEGGTLVVYPRLDPMEATAKTLLEHSHRADAACGGRLPVRFEDPALAVVLPRVFADGSFASAVIVNTRIEEQDPVRLRLRNFNSDAALWFPLWSRERAPVRLAVSRDAQSGDALVLLPALGAWSGGFLSPAEPKTCDKGTKREALVFVGAHPDDSEGYAATAFLLKDRYDIHVVDLTRGELGLGKKGLDDGSTAKRRTAEEQAACAKLGATPHFLHEIDGFACAGKPSVDALVKLIDELKPRAVFTHWPVDTHADHVQTAAVVANALRFTSVKPERYFFEVMFSQTSNYRPLYRVDVSSTIGKKLDMLSCYACQNVNDSLLKDNRHRAETRGRQNGVAFAETFTTYDGKRIEGGVLESLGDLCATEGPLASSTYVAAHPTKLLPLPTDRAKAIATFEENVYGRRPSLAGFKRTAKVIATREVPELKAVRKDILLNTLTPRGETNFLAVCYVPKAAKPVPAFVKISLRPVTGFAADPYAMELYRKTDDPRVPLAEVLRRGFAVMMFHHASVFPDNKASMDGIERPADGWGAISAWALAASRCLDWLETEKSVDGTHVAVIGHSRGGKTAIWAGVTDTRFALVISNDSGCSGARMSAVVSKPCEKIADITKVFPYWFAPNYRTRWAGKDTELPFDHHQLLALVAPRLLAVGSAIDDFWACPQGEETAVRFASRAWENPCAVHYHCRDGFHTLTPEDWTQYMDFASANGWDCN